MKKILHCLMTILLCFMCAACAKQSTSFTVVSYITIEESGYDGYGSATASLDYDKIYSQFKTALTKAEITREQLPNFLTIESPADNTLSNGQTVNIAIKTINTEQHDINEITKEKWDLTLSYTMSNLLPRSAYNPFDELKVSASGLHGTGMLTAYIEHYGKEASWNWPVEIDATNGSISNGDIVRLTLGVDKNEAERKYGLQLTETEYDYFVDILPSYPRSSSDLDNISEENLAALNKVIEDWVISGENDENVMNNERTYHFETAILLTKESDSRICFIYHIEDGYVPSGYYVYLSPNYTVLVDNENDTLITGDHRPLSNSFAKYDKETVRYTEKWGWGQDYERQGFMYRDVPYAGKATLEDMITYLCNWYADYPVMYQKHE